MTEQTSHDPKEYPSADYVAARVGRDVRVVYPNGGEVWGLLERFENDVLTVQPIPADRWRPSTIPLDAVAKLYVRG